MDETNNTQVVEALYAAFGRQDLEAVLALLSEDVEWQHPRPRDIPWGGKRSGREAVAGFFQAVGSHVEVDQFVPQHWVVSGNQVIVFGTERMKARETKRAYEVDWVHVFGLRRGKVVEFHEYTDTATIVEALASQDAEGNS